MDGSGACPTAYPRRGRQSAQNGLRGLEVARVELEGQRVALWHRPGEAHPAAPGRGLLPREDCAGQAVVTLDNEARRGLHALTVGHAQRPRARTA